MAATTSRGKAALPLQQAQLPHKALRSPTTKSWGGTEVGMTIMSGVEPARQPAPSILEICIGGPT
eukprot:scaffold47_cov112-Isochrysis_galbana.AAC.3